MFEKLFGKRSKVQQMAEGIDEESLKRLAALISESDKASIISLAEQGRKIEAVQLVREITGSGLKDAKDIVDDFQKYFG